MPQQVPPAPVRALSAGTSPMMVQPMAPPVAPMAAPGINIRQIESMPEAERMEFLGTSAVRGWRFYFSAISLGVMVVFACTCVVVHCF